MSLNILFYQFGLEKKGEKTLNFWPKLLTNPFAKNWNFATCLYQCFCILGKDFLYHECRQTLFWSIWRRKTKDKKTWNFPLKNHGLMPLQKM